MKTRLLIAFCALVLAIAPRLAPAQDKLIEAVVGATSAKLERVDDQSALARLETDRAVGSLRYVNQRLAAVDSALRDEATRAKIQRPGKTPSALAFALYSEDGPIVVEALLASGADPDEKLFGAPLLWHALARDDARSTQNALTLLEYGADPNAATEDGETPLHRAVASGNFWAARGLLESGADRNAKWKNQTADKLAKVADVKALLKDWGAKPYPYSSRYKGATPLAIAAARNNYYAVKRRLAKGDDPNKTWQGKKPIDLTSDDDVRALLSGKGGAKGGKGRLVFSKTRLGHIYRGDYERGGLHSAGGHSYAAYFYMKDANFGVKTHALYENGVQVCSVERRSDRRTADDPKNPQHTFFPSSWTRGDIVAAINEIAFAGLKEAQGAPSTKLEENVDGVRIVVILRANDGGNVDVITAYPIFSRQPKGDGKSLERFDAASKRVGR